MMGVRTPGSAGGSCGVPVQINRDCVHFLKAILLKRLDPCLAVTQMSPTSSVIRICKMCRPLNHLCSDPQTLRLRVDM